MDAEYEMPEQLLEKNLNIVTGHYGSGKTEFAVNLALRAAEAGRRTAIADLDAVNPYFRSRERIAEYEKRGIRMVATSQDCVDADLPVLPAELNALLQTPELFSVLDIGGDPVGARPLGGYIQQIARRDYRMIFVCNANRPCTATVETSAAYMEAIGETAGLPVTAIVHNTHLCGAECMEDILEGADMVRKLSEQTGVPILCHMVEERFAAEAAARLPEPVFPIQIYMKKPWEE